MTNRTCHACNQPPRNTTHLLCHTCMAGLRDQLNNLPALVAELATTMSRQTRTGRGARTTPIRAMIHYDLWPAELRDNAHTTVHHWTTTLLGGHPASWPAPDWFPHLCRALADNLDPRREDITHLHDEITDLTARITRTIDRPPDKLYAGTCRTVHAAPQPQHQPGNGDAHGHSAGWRCDEPIYATPGSPETSCPRCGTRIDVTKRRETMLNDIHDQLLTAADAAGLLAYLGDLNVGRTRTRKLINQWHRRGRLAAHGRTDNGEPRFVFGEIVALLARSHTNRKAAA